MLYLTRQQVREVDRLAIEKYHIPGIVLMENASRGAADVAMSMLRLATANIALILCGGGNNGGDGLAVARHLHNRGVGVRIGLCTDPAGYTGDALTNWQVVQAMGLPCFQGTPQAIREDSSALIIDAIFGTGLSREPRPPFSEIVEAVGQRNRPVLAIDVPSGLDCDIGFPLGACIRATQTVTFVARKKGFAKRAARAFTGRITVVDIGSPRELTEQVLKSADSSPG